MSNDQTAAHDQQSDEAERIATLNDMMRRNIRNPAPNIVVMSSGIITIVDDNPEASLAKQFELLDIVSNYSDFNYDNDPHGERDFGQFTFEGIICFWKIDCYDRKQTDRGSSDPGSADKTCRILTIMRADEY